MNEDKKDNNTNKRNEQEQDQEFRLNFRSKLFLIGFFIISLAFFALFYKNSLERRRKVLETNNLNKDEKIVGTDEHKDDDKDKKDDDNKNSSIKDSELLSEAERTVKQAMLALNILFGDNMEISEEMLYDLKEEESFIYYDNNIYEWLPEYKTLSPDAIENIGYESNYYGRIGLAIEYTDKNPKELNEDSLKDFNDRRVIGLYNPQISEEYIDHVGIIDDNFLILKINSNVDFDYHVYKKSDFKLEDNIKDNFKNNKRYFTENFVDKRLVERIKSIKPLTDADIENYKTIWIDDYDNLEKHKDLLANENNIEKKGYVFIESNANEDLYRTYYGIFINNSIENTDDNTEDDNVKNDEKDILIMLDIFSILSML